MRATPRERAAAAFAVIDRHHDSTSSVCPMLAYTQLAAAMDAEFGPLPDNTEAMQLAQMRRRDREAAR